MNASAALANDKNEISAAINLLINPGDVFELRIPKAGKFRTISGYFDNADALTKSLAGFPADQLPGVYITLNPLNPALMARANNRAVAYAENSATDKDVLRRHWFPLDFDAVRPAGISSSDAEHDAAHRKAVAVREHLSSLGWPDPIYADSGNGAHMLYRVDLPNDDDTRAMMQQALESLSTELSDEQIKIDRSVFNAARIWKLYGTVGRKGENMPDRPHRLARVLHVPASIEVLLHEQIAAVIKREPASAPVTQQYRGGAFDLGAWIAQHGIAARGPFDHNNGLKWILDVCPFNPEHNRGEAMLGIAPNGGIFFKCQHESCQHHTWADVRERFEGARLKPVPQASPKPPANDNKPEPPAVAEDEDADPFRILGYDHETYFFFQREKNQMIRMTKSDMTENGFFELAPAWWWTSLFPKKNAVFDKAAASDWLIRQACKAGIYDPACIRGRGAWTDADRAIFHFGDALWVDGRVFDISSIKSEYVYEKNRRLPHPDIRAMTDAEGRELVEVARMFRWTKPASAALLAGWVAIAPICGAMRWRPHIWITGGAGCGKTTVLNEYVHRLMGGLDVFAQGNSTEAGIRQTLRSDALPVLFDETEQNNDRETGRVQNVLSMIRQSSTESEAVTHKGTPGGEAMHFCIRSMFCLSSIQVGMKHQADFERLTVLALRPKREDKDASANWKALSERLYCIGRDKVIPARLLRRSLDLLPTTLANIQTFIDAAACKFGSVREGDQYGTLMAGCWSLMHSTVATPDQAAELIASYDWDEYRENIEADESIKALSAMMECQVRTSSGVSLTLYEVAMTAANIEASSSLSSFDAESLLKRYGMRLAGDDLLLSNNTQAVAELLRGTPYAADVRGQLLRVPGVRRHPKPVRFNGVLSKCIAIPMSAMADEGRNDRPF